MPPEPKAYELKLPPTFEAPVGQDGRPVPFNFSEADPAIQRAREWAHNRKLSQEEFSEALGLYAAKELQRDQEMQTYRDAEVKKLGDAGPARIDAILTWAKAIGGAGAAGDEMAKTFHDMLWTADQVKAVEKVMIAFASPAGSRFSSGNSAGDEPGKIPGMDKAKTFEEKRALQDRFNQASRSPAAARR